MFERKFYKKIDAAYIRKLLIKICYNSNKGLAICFALHQSSSNFDILMRNELISVAADK